MNAAGRRNWILGGLLVAVVAVIVGAQPNYTRPNLEFMPAMRRSPSFEAYEPNPVLPGGTTMQTAPEGAIPRGAVVLHYKATPEDAIRAGKEIANPIPKDSKERQRSVLRGRAAFGIYCSPCHGSGGAADGTVVKRGYPPPPSLLTGKSLQMQDGQLFHILTYGQGNMASFAGQLAPDERWDLINFVRSLQEAEAKRVEAEKKREAEKKKEAEEKKENESKDTKTAKPKNGKKNK